MQIDFRFRTSPTEMIDPQSPATQNENSVKSQPSAKNFAEFLAQHTSNCKKNRIFYNSVVKVDEIDKFYGYYIKALRMSYENLVEFHAYILRLCFNEQQRNDFHRFLVTTNRQIY